MVRSRSVRRIAIAVVAIVTLAALALVTRAPAPAEAHGKELAITVTSLMPASDEPLTRLYRVSVVFAADGDPVDGASVVLTASRAGGESRVDPMRLTTVEGRPGLYVGEVTFVRFGDWTVHLLVEAALGQGEGETEFVDDVRPGAISAATEAALKAEGERVYRLQLFFTFGLWPDVANIAVRIVHSMAGLAYFVLTGLAFVVAWLGVPSARRDLPPRLARVFMPAALGSLGLLLAAGLYSAAFDAPITTPGIYNVERMRQIPYGDWYLAAFSVKVVLFTVLVVLTVRMSRALHGLRPPVVEAGDVVPAGIGAGGVASASEATALSTLRRLTLVNAGAGTLVLADIAVVIYLHYISHLGVFLPPQ